MVRPNAIDGNERGPHDHQLARPLDPARALHLRVIGQGPDLPLDLDVQRFRRLGALGGDVVQLGEAGPHGGGEPANLQSGRPGTPRAPSGAVLGAPCLDRLV
jgi:hypothetical protein